jgi:hypothetical protein
MEDYDLYLSSAIYTAIPSVLFSIWKDSVELGTEGEETRKQITEALPHIAEVNNIVYIKGMTFREFLEAYDRKRVDACFDVRMCVNELIREGNQYAIRYLFSKEDFYDDYIPHIPLAIELGKGDITDWLFNRFLDSSPKSDTDFADLQLILMVALKFNNDEMAKWFSNSLIKFDRKMTNSILRTQYTRKKFILALQSAIGNDDTHRIELYMYWIATREQLQEACKEMDYDYADEKHYDDDMGFLVRKYLS